MGAEIQEVVPGVFLITEKGSFGVMRPPVNIYVIPGPDGLVFDAGYGNLRSLRQFERGFREIEGYCTQKGLPFCVRRIIPSHAHPDHFAGLKKLRKRLGFKVLLAPKTAAVIANRQAYRRVYNHDYFGRGADGYPLVKRLFWGIVQEVGGYFYEGLYGTAFIKQPDRLCPVPGPLKVNGEQWLLLASPGHSEDHISLYDPVRGLLFAGDNVLRTLNTWLGPPRSDLEVYVASLRELRALPGLRMILSAHGSPIERPAERIDEIIAWRRRRVWEVYGVIRDSAEGISLRGIFKVLYPGEGWMKWVLAEGWMRLTVNYLEGRGWIVSERRGSRRYYLRGIGEDREPQETDIFPANPVAEKGERVGKRKGAEGDGTL